MVTIGREPRIEFAGACYHVVQRGNNQEDIFNRDKFKHFMISTLQTALATYDFKLLAYVLMRNHYHLLIITLSDPLSKIMHQINGRFAQFYNWWNNRSGHVFQGRYRAYLVQDDRYLFTALRYIHQNPVRAGLAENTADYSWSSDIHYRKRKSGFVDTECILGMLSDSSHDAVKNYSLIMNDHVDDEEKALFYSETRPPGVTEIAATREMFTQKPVSPVLNLTQDSNTALDSLLRQCCTTNLDYSMIKTGSRLRALKSTKLAFVKKARDAGYTFEEIAASMSLSKQAVIFLAKNFGNPR